MKLPCVLAACTLFAATASPAAPTYNGRVQGVFDGHAIDVPVICERPRLAGQTGNWFYAQSDPPTHEYPQDRNGDGLAVTVSFSGRDATFALFIGGQDYQFGNTRREQLQLTDSGIMLTMQASRYEGRGRDRRKVGESEIRLRVDCPRP